MARLDLGVRRRVSSAATRGLEAVGITSPTVQRAVLPIVVAAVVLAAFLPLRSPDPAFLVLLAITYVLYVLPSRFRRFALPLTVFGLAIAYPVYLEHLFAIPVFEDFPSMDNMVAIAVFTMMALGLNMVVGYAGLLDLGFVAFYAVGAYVAAWMASPHFSTGNKLAVDITLGSVNDDFGIGGFHLSIWLVLVIAAITTAVAGVLIGLPTLRLRGDYLAIVTLGFGEVVAQVARNGDEDGIGQLVGIKGNTFNLTNGPPGINPIDPPGFGKWLDEHLGLPANFGNEAGGLSGFSQYVTFVNLMYWGAIALVLITLFCSIRLRDSRLGRAWIAIREDETAASAMGVPLMRTKTWAYASGAFFGGIAGAWFATFKTAVFPDDFLFNISVFILCMVILGGMGNVWGVMAGAFFLVYLNTQGLSSAGGWLNDNVFPCTGGGEAGRVYSNGCIDTSVIQFGIYGLIIVIVMLLRPQGLFPEERRKLELEEGVHDEPLVDVQR